MSPEPIVNFIRMRPPAYPVDKKKAWFALIRSGLLPITATIWGLLRFYNSAHFSASSAFDQTVTILEQADQLCKPLEHELRPNREDVSAHLMRPVQTIERLLQSIYALPKGVMLSHLRSGQSEFYLMGHTTNLTTFLEYVTHLPLACWKMRRQNLHSSTIPGCYAFELEWYASPDEY